MTTKEINTARDKMQTYVSFATYPTISQKQKDFYIGAATAINDLLCDLGHGDTVETLINQLNAETQKE